ncbi:Activator of Hsp90 ATPase homolog 1-like protein [Chitinophaga sp. CF118]|uniref:SRPBCC family protein n=1 Tax=Chitinophaga sp. CF118 TaxID=1884367 RepID=UPI0008E87723|nr:SRPBCC domain-containing protein [Chitinophaga sp. CF118]SFD60098.1 Activator of Hsp90 ATPase homolog 1-like protein [Chitinophaga sp. CF118]
MENFNWKSFTKKIAVKASLGEVYDAWTKPQELESWFLEKVIFYDADKAIFNRGNNIEQGLSYEWYWYLYEEPMLGKITSVNGKDFLQFTFEGECLVDVKLEENGEFTIITLIHHNIPEDNNSKQFVRLGCSNGWTFYLTNFKSVIEGGLDLRNKDDKLGIMINN